MAHSYTCLLYHLVFSTKGREPWLQGELRPRLWEYLSGTVRGEGGFCLVANGVADHVHLLVRLRQDKAGSDLCVRSRQTLRAGFMTVFQSCGVSIGKRDMAHLRLANPRWKRCVVTLPRRKPNHRKLTFQEEFLVLLRAHKIEYDERYIWR